MFDSVRQVQYDLGDFDLLMRSDHRSQEFDNLLLQSSDIAGHRTGSQGGGVSVAVGHTCCLVWHGKLRPPNSASLAIAMTRAAEATVFLRSQVLKLALFMHGSGA